MFFLCGLLISVILTTGFCRMLSLRPSQPGWLRIPLLCCHRNPVLTPIRVQKLLYLPSGYVWNERLLLSPLVHQIPTWKKSKEPMGAPLVRGHFLRKLERLMVVVLTCFVSCQLMLICTWPFIIICCWMNHPVHIYNIYHFLTSPPFLFISTFIHLFISAFSL